MKFSTAIKNICILYTHTQIWNIARHETLLPGGKKMISFMKQCVSSESNISI